MTSLSDRFASFEAAPPRDLFGDPIWRLPAYRIALFLSQILEEDTSTLQKNRCPPYVVDQFARAVDSIRANIAEGYSRYSGRERARFYEIALGSAREGRDWYRRTIPWLGEHAAAERAALLTRVIKILLVAIPQERSGATEYRLRRTLKRSLKDVDNNPGPSPSTQDKQQ